MIYLVTASLIWAFSFGLIKHVLVSPGMDPFVVALVRLVLSVLVFLPFLRLRGLGRGLTWKLVLVGGIQYGIMYTAYMASYRWLAAHQVALFTVLTPLYVTLLHDLLGRRFNREALLSALLAVAGAAYVVAGGTDVFALSLGFLAVQLSNVCFAVGQVWYRRLLGGTADSVDVRDHRVFALLYMGGVAAAALPCAAVASPPSATVTAGQLATLIYLGVVPSGVCFFLWNVGARRTRPGTLAVMNNAKVPLAVLCSLAVFGESADLVRLAVGGAALVAAVLIGERDAGCLKLDAGERE